MKSSLSKFASLLIAILAVSISGSIGHATTVVPPTFKELVNGSDYVVRTMVKSVVSEWKEVQGQRQIFTQVELEVLEVISGTPPQPLVLEMLGGKVGSEQMVVQGVPRFAVGQEDILFVRGNGRQFFPLTAAMHGRYLVVREQGGRVHIERANRKPLHNTAEVSQPMADAKAVRRGVEAQTDAPALSLEDFAQQIRATVDHGQATK